jgi:hypothetical protein
MYATTATRGASLDTGCYTQHTPELCALLQQHSHAVLTPHSLYARLASLLPPGPARLPATSFQPRPARRAP